MYPVPIQVDIQSPGWDKGDSLSPQCRIEFHAHKWRLAGRGPLAGAQTAPHRPDPALEAPTPWALVCQGKTPPARPHPAFILGAFTSTFLPPFTIFAHLQGLVLISVISCYNAA